MDGHSGQHSEAGGNDQMNAQLEPFPWLEVGAFGLAFHQHAVFVLGGAGRLVDLHRKRERPVDAAAVALGAKETLAFPPVRAKAGGLPGASDASTRSR